ncbi:HAMP domain-containing histidine kinase [Ancylothrix sp. C2]|uniref:sensor histidine kinase n=1 Tax=Ancylothrix sp. D3o TaxID=2953691 RepID=UPI0021BB39AD|nr:HAMP domain-containing sensor histidine kinase [Ancylothrix sp. D3o]MCT7948380.1 HAMP domain-containing histidine kinase [Ancylothrix sp. D3o]
MTPRFLVKLMNWTNWLYWAVGLGIGFGVKSLWKSTPTGTFSATAPPPVPTPNTSQVLEQLKQTQVAYLMASQISQFKGGFLARISHELRAPLNGIIGTHQLILTGLCDSPDEEKEFLEQASESALKLVKLIDNILSVAKAEHGTEEMKMQPVSLAEVFDELEDLTHLQAEDRNLKLQIFMPEEAIYVLADRSRLIQVLVCLVDENLRLMKEGSLTVSASLNSGDGEVGIMIDSPCLLTSWNEPIDLLKHLPTPQLPINPSFQLSPGMSLLMCQILLELMNGKLELVPAVSPRSNVEISQFRCLVQRCVLPQKPGSLAEGYAAPSL